jgi:hypothetical protein
MNDEFAYVYDWEIEVIGDLDRASLSSQIRYFKDDLFEKLDADAD